MKSHAIYPNTYGALNGWVEVIQCRHCYITGYCYDLSAFDPCPNCGSTSTSVFNNNHMRRRVGKWVWHKRKGSNRFWIIINMMLGARRTGQWCLKGEDNE